MRTTIDIDDDVLRAAKAIAASQRVSLGRAVSALARESLSRPLAIATVGRLPVFDVAPDALPITNEMVRAGIADDE
jgi:hypothetical protein